MVRAAATGQGAIEGTEGIFFPGLDGQPRGRAWWTAEDGAEAALWFEADDSWSESVTALVQGPGGLCPSEARALPPFPGPQADPLDLALRRFAVTPDDYPSDAFVLEVLWVGGGRAGIRLAWLSADGTAQDLSVPTLDFRVGLQDWPWVRGLTLHQLRLGGRTLPLERPVDLLLNLELGVVQGVRGLLDREQLSGEGSCSGCLVCVPPGRCAEMYLVVGVVEEAPDLPPLVEVRR